jgi:hypothetical protein
VLTSSTTTHDHDGQGNRRHVRNRSLIRQRHWLGADTHNPANCMPPWRCRRSLRIRGRHRRSQGAGSRSGIRDITRPSASWRRAVDMVGMTRAHC